MSKEYWNEKHRPSCEFDTFCPCQWNNAPRCLESAYNTDREDDYEYGYSKSYYKPEEYCGCQQCEKEPPYEEDCSCGCEKRCCCEEWLDNPDFCCQKRPHENKCKVELPICKKEKCPCCEEKKPSCPRKPCHCKERECPVCRLFKCEF